MTVAIRMRKLAVILAVLAVGLLFVQFISLTPSVEEGNRFAERVNLALRRTAHHLLAEKGDSTSRIAPVQQLNATTFLVRLERPFEYTRLPALLQQSLDVHEISNDYDVAVLDCSNGELQLGYNFLDFKDKNEVPCVGRKQEGGCYNLQVSFRNVTDTSSSKNTSWWAWPLGVLLLGGALLLWQKTEKPVVDQAELSVKKPEETILLGQTSFNIANQSVEIAGEIYTLTYREAKLLNLFVRHPNQLLERDFILKSVWEDEGIIVGRSVDVFVSRLRKLLQPDPGLRIVAVHGVGYRLEVIQA